MYRRQLARWVPGAGVLALALTLGGCSGADEPLAPPSTTAPSAPPVTSAAESAPPAPPAAALAHTDAGAEAFVRYYIGALNAAFTTDGDTDALRAASAPGCLTCADLAGSAERLERAGGSRAGGEWVPGSIAVSPGPDARTSRVTVELHVNAGSWKPSGDAERQDLSADDTTRVFALEQSDPGWVVADIGEPS